MVRDNCSGPPLDKTEVVREEDGGDWQVKVTEAEGVQGLCLPGCLPTS